MKNIEKYKEAKRLLDSGLTHKQIADIMGTSVGWVPNALKRLKRFDEGSHLYTAYQAEKDRIEWMKGLSAEAIKWIDRAKLRSKEELKELKSETLTVRYGYVALAGWELEGGWSWTPKKIPLRVVNEIRAWLGVPSYVVGSPPASKAEIARSRRLLEENGWQVVPPAGSDEP